jgi:predicted lipoprotein with Yx(FWY)xxD motif
VVLIAACGSASSTTGPSTSGSSQSGQSSGGPATVVVKTVAGYGEVLANASGKPLYLLTADPTNASSCNHACASQWPPLTVSGKPTAGSGLAQSKLSTFKRDDGKAQVSYGGHALYTYTGPSPTAGAGMASDGGVWYLVSPAGTPVKSTTSGGY